MSPCCKLFSTKRRCSEESGRWPSTTIVIPMWLPLESGFAPAFSISAPIEGSGSPGGRLTLGNSGSSRLPLARAVAGFETNFRRPVRSTSGSPILKVSSLPGIEKRSGQPPVTWKNSPGGPLLNERHSTSDGHRPGWPADFRVDVAERRSSRWPGNGYPNVRVTVGFERNTGTPTALCSAGEIAGPCDGWNLWNVSS